MKIIIYALLVIIPVAALSVVTYTGVKAALAGGSRRRILVRNAAVFFAVLVLVSGLALFAGATDAAVPADSAAAAETQEEAPAAAGGITDKGLGLIAAALVTSLAGIGGGIAVAAGAPAAIAAASENASSFGKSLIFVALGESIALYGVVISILILNNI